MMSRFLPKPSLFWLFLALPVATAAVGCTSPLFFRGQSPEPEEVVEVELDEELRLIRDLTAPWGTNYLKIEGLALVTGLAGTGSDPAPSSQRSILMGEMQSHEVKNPSRVLASKNTSMVVVVGYLPPGVEEGDRFDVEVRVRSRSDTTSLDGGWLMRTRMRELAVLDNAIRSGDVTGLAQGTVLLDEDFAGEERKNGKKRGRVLGGGVALESRPMELVVRSEHSSVRTSAMIGAVINGRFHTFERGIKAGVAVPKRDNYIELTVHPRYRNNLSRYIRVIGSMAVGEAPADRAARIKMLERMLLEPTTAANAALQLEAIGRSAAETLKKGIASSDPEIRFYAAEALAYLDESVAAEVLAEAAEHRDLRWHAVTALSVMDHVAAYDALSHLLNSDQLETRYSAFRALRARNRHDPLAKGESLADAFSYHVISTTGEPAIHFANARRPEIVIFGHEQRLRPPAYLFAGQGIIVKGLDDKRLKVSCFLPGKEDRHEICSTELDDVIRTIVSLGGGYAEVLEAMRSARQSGDLDAHVAVGNRPRLKSHVDAPAPRDSVEMVAMGRYHVATPIPELFSSRPGELAQGSAERSGEELPADIDPPDRETPAGGIFARMWERLSR